MSTSKLLLAACLPRDGFRWRRGQAALPRVLRSAERDGVVQRALVGLLARRGRVTKVRSEDARRLIVGAVVAATKMITDKSGGIRPEENIIDVLLRAAPLSKVSREIPGDVW